MVGGREGGWGWGGSRGGPLSVEIVHCLSYVMYNVLRRYVGTLQHVVHMYMRYFVFRLVMCDTTLGRVIVRSDEARVLNPRNEKSDPPRSLARGPSRPTRPPKLGPRNVPTVSLLV